jgi:predicted RNase H-like HicB family nuclease
LIACNAGAQPFAIKPRALPSAIGGRGMAVPATQVPAQEKRCLQPPTQRRLGCLKALDKEETTMQELRIPLRAVFYRESDSWIAHCLEFDLVGDGSTREEALQSLSDAIGCQLDATLENRNAANLFSPADGRYFTMFAAGKDVAVGTLQLKRDHVTIEGLQTREYEGSDSALVFAGES